MEETSTILGRGEAWRTGIRAYVYVSVYGVSEGKIIGYTRVVRINALPNVILNIFYYISSAKLVLINAGSITERENH